MVAAELKKVPRGGMLPAGIVLSGGGSNLHGFAALVKETLRLPVKIARPLHVEGILEKVSDPAYAVAVGLVLWGMDREFGSGRTQGPGFGSNGGFLQKATEWAKNFLP